LETLQLGQPIWAKVTKDVGFKPQGEKQIGGDSPLFVQHWFYVAKNVKVSPVPCVVLLTHLGGSRVREGDEGRWRLSALPGQSFLMPPNIPTNWHYSGPVDDLAIYLLAPGHGVQRRLADLVTNFGQPMPFADTLVANAAQELADELDGGASADDTFMGRLANVLLEQVLRVLTEVKAPAITPRHAHYARLKKVIRHINANLADPLSIAELAALADVSDAHFRRIFIDAVGQSPHRYIRNRRLARARNLLATTNLPIAVIADECGFHGQSHLTKCFRSTHAVTPAVYRRETKGGGSSFYI